MQNVFYQQQQDAQIAALIDEEDPINADEDEEMLFDNLQNSSEDPMALMQK